MEKVTRELNILMNGNLVGQLHKAETGALSFAYADTWLNTEMARPISLSIPLVKAVNSKPAVYNFFDNLLPDNAEIKARIQARFKVATNQPFDLLASIGRDCVGAIQIIEGELPTQQREIRSEYVNDKEIAAILRGIQNNPLGMTDTANEFRVSVAGAQEKTALLFYKNKWQRPLGTTPTTHIFKLPIGFIQHNGQRYDLTDSCENEWLCAQIAAAFDLPVAKCEILNFEDVKVLSVERFDRKLVADKTWIMRRPQEDLCQALGISGNLKYQSDGGPGIETIMKFLLTSDQVELDRDTFFRAQVLFWILGAADGHAKNFSVFIEPEGRYRLTPLYDIMSSYPLIEKKQLQIKKVKMAMALRGKSLHYHLHQVTRRYFLETAKSSQYSQEKAEIILDEMLGKIESVIEKVREKIPVDFPAYISEPIFTGMHWAKEQLQKDEKL